MNYKKIAKLSKKVESIAATITILNLYSNEASGEQALSNISYQLENTNMQMQELKDLVQKLYE